MWSTIRLAVARGSVSAAVAWQALGPERTMLITDAIAAFGTGETTSSLGSHEVAVSDGAPRLAHGVLAGSVLSLDVAVRNLAGATGAPLGDVVATVTSTPAHLLGRRRTIAAGESADLTVVDDMLAVAGTVVGGQPDDRLATRAVRGD